MKIAVLDDYQGVAKQFADWSGLEAVHDVQIFGQHIGGGRDAVVEALKEFDVIAAMRERTVFDKATLQRLPNCKNVTCHHSSFASTAPAAPSRSCQWRMDLG